MRPRIALCMLLPVGLFLSGCMGGVARDEDGRYVYINWGDSQRSCQNGVCTYGQNNERFEESLRCGERTRLSWDVKDWVHGSMTVVVHDGADAEAHRRTLAFNGRANVTLEGTPGTWTLQGTTHNANGVLQVRLTCL